MNKDFSDKELESEEIKSACKSSEMQGRVQILELINQKPLKEMSDNKKSRGKYVDRMII